ncbi:hypothetical protein [Granulicella arctica]|uniref:hypothetical protein n=1 Tax=Granulicella arctica TaxID=940613 RepID=UPI0021DFDE51|nr:hypothetical protein [Granulicella arctica]
MSPVATLRKTLRRVLLGSAGRPQILDLPLHSPQAQVAVWLHGLGEPLEVTGCHAVACVAPFLLCIGLGSAGRRVPVRSQRLLLRLSERAGDERLLGEIRLRWVRTIATSGVELCLFRAVACTNFRLPMLRRWTRMFYSAHDRWKSRKTVAVKVSSLDVRCNEVVFICPRPTALVSLDREGIGNLFPMNLMGDVGEGYFVFALNAARQAPMVAEFAQVAIVTVPFERAEEVRQLGKNHHRASIEWDELPFEMRPSPVLKVPIPCFALMVRELAVEGVHTLGSHSFFVGRILHEQVYRAGPEFYRVHGVNLN